MTFFLGNCAAAILKFNVLDSQGIDRQTIQKDTVNQKMTASSQRDYLCLFVLLYGLLSRHSGVCLTVLELRNSRLRLR